MSKNLNLTLKKVVVIFLIITLTYANLILIGSNIAKGLISYALEEGEEQPELVANQELLMNQVCEINGELKRVIQVGVQTGIESEKYPIKETTLTLSTNIIEGTLEDVKVTSLNRNSYTIGTWEISEDGKLVISLVNENETLETKEKGLDKLLVTYIFSEGEIETINEPLENVEIKTYAGDVLPNECIQSNFEEINIEKDLLLLNIENKDIHKTTITDGQVEYTESLNLDLSYRKEASNIIIEDEKNDFYNNDAQKNEEIVLTYKTTTINKEDLLSLLGEEGNLTITDTIANKILVELTKETIETQELNVKTEAIFTNEETSEEEIRSNVTVTDETVEIEYVVNVTNFKLELTNIKAQSENEIEFSNFVIKNIKAISNINDVDSLNYLEENVEYAIDETVKNANSKITFKDTTTRASLDVDNTEWIVGQANTVKYTITLDTSTEKSELFVDPMFLIELPSSVESINTLNSEFIVNNDNGAFTSRRVFVTTVMERKFVVITLEGDQTEETIANGNTSIDLTLELNVSETATEGNQTTKLYYQNNTVTAYESGKSFDTAEVTVSMIMESEPKDEIPEVTEPDEGEIVPPEEDYPQITSNFELKLTSSTNKIIKPDEEYEYNVNLSNFASEEIENLQINCVLPEGISILKVIEVVDSEENEIECNFNELSRVLTISVDKIEGLTMEEIENAETGEIETYGTFGHKVFKIVVKADALPEGAFSREIKNVVKLQQGENLLAESQEVVNTISDAILIIETETLPEQINEAEEISIRFKVTNKGLIDVTNTSVNVNLPEEITLSKYSKTVLSEDGQEESKVEGTLSTNFEDSNFNIQAQKTYYFELTGRVNNIKETKQVTITGTVDGKEFSWTIEIVNVTDEPEKPTNPSNPETPTEPSNPENPENPSNPENPTNPSNPSGSENKDDVFDLSLKQYLNKVTVTNSKGTTTYEYKDTNFAKVEIHSKQMNGSKVTLEYRIVVKNEGTIPGYARKIVDYIPKDLVFDSNLNPDWYLGDDGNIYSVALIDKLLNPGETAELKIVLEKQMTNENVGTITNLVEIYEASNDENAEDVNSIPGDKLEGQNDMSKVEVLISTSTGTIILYTTLAIAVIAIIGFGLYRIKKVTLNKKGGC